MPRKKPPKHKHQELPELSDAELLAIQNDVFARTKPQLTQKGNSND